MVSRWTTQSHPTPCASPSSIIFGSNCIWRLRIIEHSPTPYKREGGSVNSLTLIRTPYVNARNPAPGLHIDTATYVCVLISKPTKYSPACGGGEPIMAFIVSLCILTFLKRSVLRNRRSRLASSIFLTSRYAREKIILIDVIKFRGVVYTLWFGGGGRRWECSYVCRLAWPWSLHPALSDEHTDLHESWASGLGGASTSNRTSFTRIVPMLQ